MFRGRDERKDQSYFLSGLTVRQLSRVLTPVGRLTKKEVCLDSSLSTSLPLSLSRDKFLLLLPVGFLRSPHVESAAARAGSLGDEDLWRALE